VFFTHQHIHRQYNIKYIILTIATQRIKMDRNGFSIGVKLNGKATSATKQKQDSLCQRLHAGAAPPRLSLGAISTLKTKVHRARSQSVGSLPRMPNNMCQDDPSSETAMLEQAKKQLYHATEQERDKATLLFRAPKVFWRYHLNAEIDIYFHPNNALFEVLSYDLDTGALLPRLFIKADDVIKANQKNFDRNYREVRKL
jgi:hypothetical protein